MPGSDYDDGSETLISGKRFRVDGKKRKSNRECKTFIDNTLLWGDS